MVSGGRGSTPLQGVQIGNNNTQINIYRRLPRWALLAGALAVAMVLGYSALPRNSEADDLVIENHRGLQSTFDVYSASSPASSDEIRWKAFYTVTNSGTATIAIRDIEAFFPVRTVAGRQVRLERTGAAESVTVFSSAAEWLDVDGIKNEAKRRDELWRRVKRLPFLVPGGEERLIVFEQSFRLRSDTNVVELDADADTADALGPLFGLAKSKSGYYCSANYTLRTVVHTGKSTIERYLEYALLPSGCQIKLPNAATMTDILRGDRLGDG